MLDLKLPPPFREVAVRGSFSEAAAALDFTQPAVSQHISRLEQALGVRLLERSARGASVTPAGEVLVRHAASLLGAVGVGGALAGGEAVGPAASPLDAAPHAEEAVRDAAGIGRARVRVGAFP